jgi:stage V sporulation protein B
VILTFTLTGIPSFNVKGAAIGTVAAYIIASVLNIFAVKRLTGVKFDIMLSYVKPIVSALTMSAVVWVSFRILFGFFGNVFSTLLSILIGVAVYCAMLFITKSIRKEELRVLPKGGKILNLIGRVKK